MKKRTTSVLALGVSAAALFATQSLAGGLDRSGQGINLLFEERSAIQFSYRFVDADVTGISAADGSASGDVARAYGVPHFGIKRAFSDSFDVALIYDEPFGAHTEYDSAYFLSSFPTGSDDANRLSAEAEAHAVTILARKKLDKGLSVYGGLRLQTVEAEISVPAAALYDMESNRPMDVGYVVGVAWEKPEIAARVALTYNSSISHDLELTETTAFGPSTHTAEIETPQSVNLDFQTGVAQNTLLFGSVRWADWSSFALTSPNYLGGTPAGTLVSYDDDVFTYSIGLGYKFSEKFSGAVQLGYEDSQSGTVSDLGPTNGYKSISIGGTYTNGDVQYSGGISYLDIGDATTSNGGVFTDNSGWAAGFQITYHFD